MRILIYPEEAKEFVRSVGYPLDTEHVSIQEALGRTVGETLTAPYPIPTFASSGMDGFAVRVADLANIPATLRVTDFIPAGDVAKGTVEPGTCMRIMTGAPVPSGGDAIVPFEWTRKGARSTVTVERAPEPGQFVRPEGRDMMKGDVLVHRGTGLTPPAIGQLAAAGFADVPVHRKPRTAIIVTGNELHFDPGPLPMGKIRDSNGPALVAQVTHAGGQAMGPFVARDNKESVQAALDKAADADVILVVGGVSVGDHDIVKDVLKKAGMDFLFWKVYQRPGKPLAFGTLRGCPVFGLPGNPASTFVCFEQYVRPLLKQLQGQDECGPRTDFATLSHPVFKKEGLHHFVRGVATRDSDGTLHVRHAGPQASNLQSSLAGANCLIHLVADEEHPPAGIRVPIEWLPWANG